MGLSEPDPGATFFILVDEDQTALPPSSVLKQLQLVIAILSEAHAWAFFVFVDEDDAGVFQGLLNFPYVFCGRLR
jgi:hypothetical protein